MGHHLLARRWYGRIACGGPDLDGARTLLECALAVYEAGLGPDHPETIQSRQALAAVAVKR